MAITVKHSKVSTIPDGDDTSVVRPSDWNAEHQLTGTIPVDNGGTGVSTLTGYVKGNGTSAMTANSTIPSTDVTGLGTMSTQNSNNISVTGGTMSGVAITGYIPSTEKGAALGVATLDGGGTVPISQLPAAVLGALSYQGTWNATTNSPTLTSSIGTKGYYYVVSVAGSTNLDGITDWKVGDWAVFNGTAWQKIDNTDAVTSVNGYTGTVVLSYTDVGAFPATSTTGTGNVVLDTGSTQANPTISNYENFTPTTAPSYSEGRIWYDNAQHSLAYYNDAINSLVHVGQEVQTKVVNNTGSTITIGAPVYITSTPSGQIYPNIALAQANSIATSSVLGLATQSIANGAIGYVTSYGILQPCNTGLFNVGDILYLSPYTAGALMNVIPPTGNAIIVGVVAYKNSPNGSIYVKQENSYIVSAGTITGQVAVANGGTGVSTLTGYVKGSGTSVMTASATIPTTDLSGTITNAQLANSAITINGTSTSLGGSISVGTVTSVTGTAPVVSSGGNTPAISMAAANTTTNGYLTSTDWNTFNGKGSGSVTSVGLSAPSIFTVGGSPVTGSGTLALTYSGTALPLANGGTNATSAPEAMANLMGFTSTATSGGTTTLTNASSYYQLFTGTTTQTIVLPVTSTLQQGWTFHICNNSTGILTVNSSGGNLVLAVPVGTTVMYTCILTTGTTAASWEAGLTDFSTNTGTGAVVLASSPTFAGTAAFSSISASGSVNFNTTASTIILGNAAGTAAITVGNSTVSQTTNIQAGATASGSTKTLNIGTGGLAGSTTAINIGSTVNGTSTTTLNGVVNASSGIVCNSNTIASDFTIPATSNAVSAGPITINTGVTVTVSTGSTWVVV